MADLERCRSCNAPIRMLCTGSTYGDGSPVRMPVNPDPTGRAEIGRDLLDRPVSLRVGEGNLRLLPGGLEVRVVKAAELYEGELYTPHFATCPHARSWSQQGRMAAQRAVAAIRDRLRSGL